MNAGRLGASIVGGLGFGQEDPPMPRILFAGLFHETHCFVDETTGLEAFRRRDAAGILARRGDLSVVDAFLGVAAREGWEVVPTIDWGATPSGTVEHGVFEAFWDALEPMLRGALEEGLDGIYLALHGAMVTTQSDDPEGELLARIRAVPGAEGLPLFGVHDPHANLTPRMCAQANGLVSYRNTPHTDAFEAAERAANLLARALAIGVVPRMVWRGTPIVIPPTGTGTADSPMRDLCALARRIEAEDPAILVVNCIGGYSFGDSEHAGIAFSAIVEGDAGRAEAALARLGEMAWELRHKGVPAQGDADAVLARGLPNRKGPVLLVEPADNIGGGAPGDCTDILRAMLKHDVQGGGVILNDPAAVRALGSVAVGGRVTLSLGGKGSRLDLGPVELEVEKLSESDGAFTLEDRHSHMAGSSGIHIAMGPTSVVRHRGITIMLTSKKTAPFDLGQWRSQGIDPEELRVIGVKAAVAHRQAYDRIMSETHTVTTRGPCSSDSRSFPYAKLRRPVFPLDLE
jgi:microcystin degradation protein MlrC